MDAALSVDVFVNHRMAEMWMDIGCFGLAVGQNTEYVAHADFADTLVDMAVV